MSREVRLQMLRPAQAVAERDRVPLAILPLGPLEWHGPHLPLGTDPLDAEAVALGVAREVVGVVLPTLYIGTERERSPQMLESIGFAPQDYVVGMDFPANIMPSYYYPEEVLAIVIRATLDLLRRQGYKLVILMNGHGAENQLRTLERLAFEYSHATEMQVRLMVPVPGFMTKPWSLGHASEGETSLMMAIVPDFVDLSTLPTEGPLKNVNHAIVDDQTFRGNPTPDFTVRDEEDPRHATVESGKERMAECITDLSATVRELLAGL